MKFQCHIPTSLTLENVLIVSHVFFFFGTALFLCIPTASKHDGSCVLDSFPQDNVHSTWEKCVQIVVSGISKAQQMSTC